MATSLLLQIFQVIWSIPPGALSAAMAPNRDAAPDHARVGVASWRPGWRRGGGGRGAAVEGGAALDCAPHPIKRRAATAVGGPWRGVEGRGWHAASLHRTPNTLCRLTTWERRPPSFLSCSCSVAERQKSRVDYFLVGRKCRTRNARGVFRARGRNVPGKTGGIPGFRHFEVLPSSQGHWPGLCCGPLWVGG